MAVALCLSNGHWHHPGRRHITWNNSTKNNPIVMILGLLESVKKGVSFHGKLCGVI